MRNFKFILMAAVAAIAGLLSSCKNDINEGNTPQLGTQKVNFTSSILRADEVITSRASDISWAANDAIGIYMVESGQPVGNTNLYDNMKYVTTDGSSTFEPAAGNVMYFPDDDRTVGFVAYYPYTTSVDANNQVAVDVSSQTDLPAIDLMYSTGATGKESAPNVNLTFKHRLTNLVLEVNNLSNVVYTDLEVTLIGLPTEATFALGNNGLNVDAGSVADIDVPMTVDPMDGDKFTGKAIILPSNSVNASVNFAFPDGTSYTWDFATTQTFLDASRYTFKFNLNPGGTVDMVSPDVNGSINPWEDVDHGTGDIDLNPSADGTQANPFTVALAAGHVGENAWVTGVIVGEAASGLTRAATSSRLLLADAAGETNTAKQMLVVISDPDIAAYFDFEENSAELIGMRVKLEGTIANANDVALALSDITDFEGGVAPGTDDEITPIRDIVAAFVDAQTIDQGKIRGTVVSDISQLALNNSVIILQDGNLPDDGITLMMSTAADNTYETGTILEVDLTGTKYELYNGIKEIVNIPTANIEVVSTGETVTPVAVTDTDDLAQYMSMLVSIADAQAVDTDGTMNGTLVFQTENQAKSFNVYTRTAATFSGNARPTGKGTIVGIVTAYQSTPQLVPRNTNDFAGMTGVRDGSVVWGTPVFSAEQMAAGQAIVNGIISIPYDNQPSAGSVTYTLTADVSGIDAATNQTVQATQGSGTLEIPVTGTPATAGTVTFTIDIDGEQLTATGTVTAAGSTNFEAYWNTNGKSFNGTGTQEDPFAVTSVTPASLQVGDLTGHDLNTNGSSGVNNWGGINFSANREDDPLNPEKYMTFTLDSDQSISISAISVTLRITGSGPLITSFQYSFDGNTYAEAGRLTYDKPGSTTTFPSRALDTSTVADLQDIAPNTTVTIRIVPIGTYLDATTSTGNWYLNGANVADKSLAIEGTLQ